MAGKNPTYERWRRTIFGITWLAYAGMYLTRKAFSAAKVALGPDTAIGLTKGQMAGIDTAYSVAYAAGQFIFGIAGDRLGTRRVVMAGLVGSVLAAIATGMSGTALAFGVFMFLQGIFQSTGWAPLSKNLARFFSRRERGAVMGFWCTNYAVGGWVATVVAAVAAEKFGWRYAFFLPAAGLLAIAALFYVFQRNRPEDVGLPPIETYHAEKMGIEPEAILPRSDRTPWTVVKDVLRSPMVLMLCFTYFCLKPARYLLLFWGPQYIHETLDTGVAVSAFVSSTFELGGPIGVLLGGLISDKVFGSRRVPVAVISLLMLAVIFYFMKAIPHTKLALGGALFVIGLFLYAADSLLSGTAAVDFGTEEGASTASGLINGSGSIGQIIGPAIPGLVPKSWGWSGVFGILSLTMLFAGLVLAPRWNAMPSKKAAA